MRKAELLSDTVEGERFDVSQADDGLLLFVQVLDGLQQ